MMPTEPIIFSMFILGVPIIVLMCVGISMYYYINVTSKDIEHGWLQTFIGFFFFVAIPSALLGYGIAKLLGVL